MTALEGAAITAGRVSGSALMEAAGAGVVAAVEARRGAAAAPGRAVVLCGPGNNGGDGYVIARLLRQAGWQVALWALAPPGSRSPDAQAAARAWEEAGGGTQDWEAIRAGGAPDLLVDAVFGTGLTRPLPAALTAMAAEIGAAWDGAALLRVAVDLPSGLSSESGRVITAPEAPDAPGAVLPADLCVTFHSAKPGHYLAEGPALCGRLEVVPLPGLPDAGAAGAGADPAVARLVTPGPGGFAGLAKRPGHKFDHGHALVLSGPPGAGGAARLAARSALRIGAGLVTLGCPMRALPEHAAQLTAIMLQGLDGTAGLAEHLEDGRINALCLGPGLGQGGATGELVRIALAARRATVLDADALSRFRQRPEVLFAMLHPDCVLTPHGGEFARLFPDLADRMAAERGWSKIEATRAAAARAGCVVLLKGADTVIAAPDGRAAVSAAAYGRAVPWLATAGAGDVLAGMICGLLARGMAPMAAAECAAWLHVEAARHFGPGLIAEDLPETLPAVFRALSL
jgi:hydroxyethylthiazole kinase-like uncharacterized protein yjeF